MHSSQFLRRLLQNISGCQRNKPNSRYFVLPNFTRQFIAYVKIKDTLSRLCIKTNRPDLSELFENITGVRC